MACDDVRFIFTNKENFTPKILLYEYRPKVEKRAQRINIEAELPCLARNIRKKKSKKIRSTKNLAQSSVSFNLMAWTLIKHIHQSFLIPNRIEKSENSRFCFV
jgi:hypothetical protein